MIRYPKKYRPSYVLAHIVEPTTTPPIEIDGDAVKMGSLRYKVFRKNLRCAYCGLEGTHFYKEKHALEHPYHFNLYGTNYQGQEVLLTKDHIRPVSAGGSDDLENMQTLCRRCNELKRGLIPKRLVAKFKQGLTS